MIDSVAKKYCFVLKNKHAILNIQQVGLQKGAISKYLIFLSKVEPNYLFNDTTKLARNRTK